MSQSLEAYLVLSALLFGIGTFGFLAKRNAIAMLMSIELMLNSVNLAIVAFGAFTPELAAQASTIALFVIALTVRGSVWDTDADLWDQMLHINTRAPGLLITAAATIMAREGIAGSIVNIGSVAAHGGQDFLYPYATSKAALQALTRNAAYTLMRRRIRVNLIQPGWMATPGEDTIQRQFHNADDGWLDRAAADRPFGRLIDPEELARTICFLASDASGLMTGAIIDFDQSVAGAGDAPVPAAEPTWGEPS